MRIHERWEPGSALCDWVRKDDGTPMSASILTLADNPAELDYLGFEELVAPIIEALDCTDEPVTVGIYGSWGSGKSTVLGMAVRNLKDRADVIVVTINPWEFDESSDVKGEVIGAVLGGLAKRFGDDADLKAKVVGMLKRVSWSRATSALLKGALTMQWDMEKLVDAFTPTEAEGPKSMAGFKDEFAGLVAALPGVTRVVVAVDDLDRCLPSAVMSALETIKLFLAVDRMAFILAADHQMVTDAVAASLSETHRNTGFANLYLDKIVQIPVQVPRLTEHDAEAYAGMLLAQLAGGNKDALTAMAAHSCARRNDHKTPLLGDLEPPLEEASRRLAAQIARGLGTDQRGTPRAVKRFLNGLHIRQRLAATRGVTLDVEVVAKLFMLEQRFPPMFRALAEALPEPRVGTLSAWEEWASTLADEDPPEGMAPEARALFEDDPALSKVDLDAYFTFASTLHRITTPAGASASIGDVVRSLLSDTKPVSAAALERVKGMPLEEAAQVLETLAVEARRSPDPEAPIRELIRVADLPDLDPTTAVAVIQELPNRVKPQHVAALQQATSPHLTALVTWIASSDDASGAARTIAKKLMKDTG